MTRALSSDPNAVSAAQLNVFYAVALEFSSGTLLMWSGIGDNTINGDVYTGAGVVARLSEVEETAELAARGAVITLDGISSSVISLALTEPYQGRIGRIYFGLVDDADNMTEIFRGYMDKMDIDEAGDTCSVALSLENKLIDLKRARVNRFTNSHQQSKYPDDKGLAFIEDLQDRSIPWGKGV